MSAVWPSLSSEHNAIIYRSMGYFAVAIVPDAEPGAEGVLGTGENSQMAISAGR